jgi:hypothetical protein
MVAVLRRWRWCTRWFINQESLWEWMNSDGRGQPKMMNISPSHQSRCKKKTTCPMVPSTSLREPRHFHPPASCRRGAGDLEETDSPALHTILTTIFQTILLRLEYLIFTNISKTDECTLNSIIEVLKQYCLSKLLSFLRTTFGKKYKFHVL